MFVKQRDYMFCNEVKKHLNCYGDKRISTELFSRFQKWTKTTRLLYMERQKKTRVCGAANENWLCEFSAVG